MSGPCCYPWIGVAAGLLGSIAINTGNNLQSLGMQNLELEELEKEGKRVEAEGVLPDAPHEPKEINPKESRTWVVGTCVFVSGSLLNFASYSLAPQSLLASLESIQFVTNVIFGKFILGKEVTQSMVLGTFLTVAGTTLAIVFSAPHGAEITSVQDMKDLWKNPAWIAYVCFIVALGAALQSTYARYQKAHLAGVPFKNSDNVMAILYSTYSALFGSSSVVFAKLMAEFLILLGQGKKVADSWFFYVVILCWLVLMLYWLKRLNDALALYDPLFIIPLLQANFIFFAIISGGIYFQEFDYMTSTHWVGFSFGVSIIFSGLYFLAPAADDDDDDNKGGGGNGGGGHGGDGGGGGGESKQRTKSLALGFSGGSNRNVRNSLVEMEMTERGSNLQRGSDVEKAGAGGERGKNSAGGGGEDEDNMDDVMRSMYKSMTVGLFRGGGNGNGNSSSNVLSGGGNSANSSGNALLSVAEAQKHATKLFMSGAAQMNHHTNRMRTIKQRKEQELIRLMSQKQALSAADAEKAKSLMVQIKLVDQSLDLSSTFENLVKDDGTMTPENVATFKEHVLSFQQTSKLDLRASSVDDGAGGNFRSSLGSIGGSFFAGTNGNGGGGGGGGGRKSSHSASMRDLRESMSPRLSSSGSVYNIFGSSGNSSSNSNAAAATTTTTKTAPLPASSLVNTANGSGNGGGRGGAAAATAAAATTATPATSEVTRQARTESEFDFVSNPSAGHEHLRHRPSITAAAAAVAVTVASTSETASSSSSGSCSSSGGEGKSADDFLSE